MQTHYQTLNNSSLSNSAITVSDGSNTTENSCFRWNNDVYATSNEVEVSESSGTVTIGLTTT